MLNVDEITFIHPNQIHSSKMLRYHLKIWEHFSDFIHSKIENISLNIPFKKICIAFEL
jgi:hypothetical protein